MRKISISSVIQSGTGQPGAFVLSPTTDNTSGNWTAVFKGRYYRDPTGQTQTFYLPDGSARPVPSGYQLIEATAFTVTDNPSYNGRYTVYTQAGTTADASHPSSVFSGGFTTVRVNQPIGAPLTGSHSSNTGVVSNVSTYYLLVAGESAPVIVPPAVEITDRPIDLTGRDFSGWGEILHQNLLNAVQHYASVSSPPNPYLGQMWYDLSTTPALMKIWTGSVWDTVNGGAFAPASSVRHTQSVASTTWTITHGLGAAAPFVVNHSFFVDVGGGVIKPILPQDVTYATANSLTVTFSTAYAGYALIRL